MSARAWVATRKGLFELRRQGAQWRIASVNVLGDPVSAVLPADPSAPGRPMIAASSTSVTSASSAMRPTMADAAGAR